EHLRICSGDGDMVEGHFTAWLNERHPDPASLRGSRNAHPAENYSVPQAYRTSMPEELYPTRYIEEETITFIEEHSRDASDNPFFVHCSFPDPHHPFTPPGKYWDMYDPDDMELPASFNIKMTDNLPPVPGVIEGFERGRADPNAYWPIEATERQAREAIALTFGMIAMIDDAIGEVLKTLQSLKLAENTIIIFASDHGDYMGDQGMLLKLGLHRHSTIRMPFIWYDPASTQPGRSDARLASTIDIAPTILDAAGLRPYHGIQGCSLLGNTEIRQGVVIEDYGTGVFRDPDAAAGILTYVTEQWRMTLFEGTVWGELYNLDDDPDEITNLWNRQDHSIIKNQLNQSLIYELIGLRDRSMSPTGQG
ncbi:MAG: sulfatase-like hydrolase/transferase, partial [Alphaproteobacteria bacterium]